MGSPKCKYRKVTMPEFCLPVVVGTQARYINVVTPYTVSNREITTMSVLYVDSTHDERSEEWVLYSIILE